MNQIDPRLDNCLLAPAWRPAGCPGAVLTATASTIRVAKSGGDYTTIREALIAANARDVIEVYPGIYQENNPLPGRANVTLKAVGELVTTRIEALNANQDLFTSANAFIVDGFALANVSGTGWVMNVTLAHSVRVLNGVYLNCSNGIRTNNVNAFVTVSDMLIFALPGVMACSYCNNAGTLTVRSGGVGPGSTITNVFDFDGANAISTVISFLSFSPGVTTMIQADNDARSVFDVCSFVGMFDGAVLQGGSDTRFVATSIFLAQQDAIRIPNVGAATNLVGQGLTIEDSTRYDINILSATATVSGYGQASLDQMNFESGAEFVATFVDLKEDDEGVNIIGELHVGLPELGSESVMGEGDSYTRGMLVYTFNPAGAVWTDVSAEARSASGSTFTFPAVAQNNAIYVASSLHDGDFLQHYGIKLSCTIAAVLGGGTIVVEYWNGGAWVAIEQMSTLAGAPYTQYANDLFVRAQSEQLRYPRAFLASWTKNDPGMGLGTNYFWIRYRVATAITTAPTFEQWKMHTSRFEVNADGVSEYFGEARYQKDLIVHLALNDPVGGAAPGSAAVAFSATTTLTITRNQFNNNSLDAFGEVVIVPEGIDTSIPITIETIWYADTVNAGDVELVAYFAELEVGDLWDGTHAESTVTEVETVGAGTRFVSRATSFDIDISELVPGELLVFKIERDARVGNDPPDTLAGNIIFGSVRAFGSFWRP